MLACERVIVRSTVAIALVASKPHGSLLETCGERPNNVTKRFREAPPAVRIDRSLELSFRGDWGVATLHAICGSLGQEMLSRAEPGSRFAIWSGSGFMDNIRAVVTGDVDVSVVTPAASLRLAFGGLGPFAGEPLTDLRAIGTLPQDDKLTLVVARDLGVSSFADIVRDHPALHLATPPDDGVNTVGFVAREIMEAAGIGPKTIRSWGGSLVDAVRPRDALGHFSSGKANAAMHEAVFADYWQEMARTFDPVFVPIDDAALQHMEQEFHWPRAELPAGYFPMLRRPLPVLDFSDFVVVVRSDMPEEVARLLTSCLVEGCQGLERRFHHIPPHRSPLTYPLDPATMPETPIPLHEGAKAYYHSEGLLDESPA